MDREPAIAGVRITQRADFSTNRKRNSDPRVEDARPKLNLYGFVEFDGFRRSFTATKIKPFRLILRSLPRDAHGVICAQSGWL
jgi:hypothetical protein